jgi:membrane-associated phospholipid phosphatase
VYIDAALAYFGAKNFPHYPVLQTLVIFIAQTNFFKALPFAPYLLLVWYSSKREARAKHTKILSIPFSSAVSLIAAWIVTSNWLRPRPLNPESGLTEISSVFLQFFADSKLSNYWGCFPSDHAAYLTALSLGIYTINLWRQNSVGLCFNRLN